MTGFCPPAVPGCAALIVGVRFGLESGWCPPGYAALLVALGLALRGQTGRTVIFLGVGLIVGCLHARQGLQPAPDRPVMMRVEITGMWRSEEDGIRVTARGLWIRQGLYVARWDRDVRLILPRGETPPESPHLRVRGYLRRPVAPANGVRAVHGMWTLRVKSRFFVAIDDRGGGRGLRLWRSIGTLLRGPVERRLAELEKRGQHLAAMLVKVLVFGQPHSMPGSMARGLRAAGLAHLVALSGLHVGLLVGIALTVTSATALRYRVAVVITVAIAYVLLAGIRPSLLRATLMMMALMVSWMLRRPPRPLNVLAWVAAAMVIAEPQLVGKLGFQLTVAATGGILLLASRLEHRWRGLPENLRKPLSVSVAAHLAVLPWTLSVFHLATPLSPLWNLLAVPWAALALAASFAWVLTSVALPPLGSLLSRVLELLATPLTVFESLSPDRLGAVPVDVGGWAASALAAALILTLLSTGRTRFAIITLTALCLILRSDSMAIDPELILLDVGQGEAIVLRDGEEALLVDGGGWRRADIAQKILLPALTRVGVRRLTGMILSHPDTDHCGGLLMLTSYMPTERLYISAGWRDPCALELLTRPDFEIHPLWRGERLQVGRWQIETLHPRAGSRTGRNNRSLVLLAEVGEARVLLTGDLEAAGENQILDRMRSSDHPGVDLLKVGHHGSDTSTTAAWLDWVRPRIALISCGVANRYGHPNPEVLTRLHNRRVTTLRTDQRGMIQISIGSGNRMQFRFPGQPRETGSPESSRQFVGHAAR